MVSIFTAILLLWSPLVFNQAEDVAVGDASSEPASSEPASSEDATSAVQPEPGDDWVLVLPEDVFSESAVDGRWLDRRRKRRESDPEETNVPDNRRVTPPDKRKNILDRIDDKRDRKSDSQKDRADNFTLASARFWHVVFIGAAALLVILMTTITFGVIGLFKAGATKIKQWTGAIS